MAHNVPHITEVADFENQMLNKKLDMKKIEEKINEWWNKDLFVIDIGIYEISVDNGIICSLILIIVGLISLM